MKQSRKTLIFDIEANGFYDDVHSIWMLVCQDVETKEVTVFSDHNEEARPLAEAEAFVKSYKMIAGHNIYGYDIPVIDKILGWQPDWDNQKVLDTLTMSWMLDYKRHGGHSLGSWGKTFKYPKGDFKEFHRYSQEMLDYCIQDVKLNTMLYEHLITQCKRIIATKPLFAVGLKVEHRWAYYEMLMRLRGWKFNEHLAYQSVAEWRTRMEEIESIIHPTLKTRCLNLGEYTPRYKKDGDYYASSIKWFGDQAAEIVENKSYWGPVSRIEFSPAEMGNMENIKAHLLSLGWQPDDFNVKRGTNGKWIETGPKLTDSSLKKLDEALAAKNHPEAGYAAMISEYYTWRSRRSVVEGWIKSVKDGRLHPRTWTIGTPTYRCRHEVITNLPGVDSPGGKAMRAMLVAEPGYKTVGADSSGNQFRALAHYMKDEEFTKSVISGSSEDGTDVHSRNAKLIGCNRKTAKPFIYALTKNSACKTA